LAWPCYGDDVTALAESPTDSNRPPVVALVARSGTGKTTLLEGVLAQFSQWGLRVGVIKHTHHDVELDQPGKDSHRLRQAGATQLLLASPWRQVRFEEFKHGSSEAKPPEPNPLELAKALAGSRLDLILAEGFKRAQLPKIELRRTATGQPPLPSDPHVIAIASDDETLQATVPILNLNDPTAVATFIRDRFLPQP